MGKKQVVDIDCPSCRGFGEIMVRDFAVDSDGSQDIGTTPYPTACTRCNGTGKILLNKLKGK